MTCESRYSQANSVWRAARIHRVSPVTAAAAQLSSSPSTRSAVLITATETEPRRFGKQVVLGGVLDHLVERLGAAQVHVVLVGAEGAERPSVPYQRHVIAKPGSITQGTSVLRRTVLPALLGRETSSLQESVLCSNPLREQLRDKLATIGADLEIWDTVRMGQHAPTSGRCGARRVLYADDLFSVRYAAMLAEADFGDAGGQFAAVLPGPARRLLGNRHAQRSLLRCEQRLVARSEERQPAWFDRTLLVSDAEAQVLRDRLQPRPEASRTTTLPPRLKTQDAVQTILTDRPVFTFIGGFGYAPNRQGLEWFLRSCRDAVLSRIPGLIINVVGPGTEEGLPAAEEWGDAIRFHGWVDDLDAILATSNALLSPLRSGSGIKIKVMEALSRGLPVVATSAGAQGIARSARPGGTGILVADEPEELAAAMAVVCDPQTRSELARAARRTWDTSYAPAVVESVYDEVFALPVPGSALSETAV